MSKIRLTKNELKRQKDDLKRFLRYLPTLELKKNQLVLEIRSIQQGVERLKQDNDAAEETFSHWAAVFADRAKIESLIRIQNLKLGTGNIAGIDIPLFEALEFEEIPVDFFSTPVWVDAAVIFCRERIRNRIEISVLEKQQQIIREELRTTIQRIKLFEEVKIPQAEENIRIIRIFLGDMQTAEVVRGKIAKSKIQRKRREVAA